MDRDEGPEEEALVRRIENQVKNTPPRCICGFRCAPAELPEPWDDNFTTVWQLACSCQGKAGSILGYSLADYNREFHGPEALISPIAFECSGCCRVTEILDTGEHGYNPEVGRVEGYPAGTHFRGTGPRKRFRCPTCLQERFGVTVGFVYWGFDLFLDKEEMIAGGIWRESHFDHPEDFFNVFLSFARCAGCGALARPTKFGKL